MAEEIISSAMFAQVTYGQKNKTVVCCRSRVLCLQPFQSANEGSVQGRAKLMMEKANGVV